MIVVPAGAAKAPPSKAARKKSEAADSDTDDDSDDVVIELNGLKRTATVAPYKGTLLVSIREYYEVCTPSNILHIFECLPLTS